LDISFDVKKKWAIVAPSDLPHAKKSVEDLSRYLFRLTGVPKTQAEESQVMEPHAKIYQPSDPPPSGPVILLDCGGGSPERNGFEWRAGNERVEIHGESGRGLCNGIYSFLAALGLSWPGPGNEKLPEIKENPQGLPLAQGSVCEPSRFDGKSPAAAPLRRLVLAEKKAMKTALKNGEAFAAWAARNRYDAFIFPLAAFASGGTRRKLAQLKHFALEYGIAIEAGGWAFSSLVPRKYFFLHRDFFRMEEGKRTPVHHFCPTSPGAIQVIGKEGKKLFKAAGTEVLHVWSDKGAETVWCFCPACRAFTPQEQNRIGVNAAADALTAIDAGASISYFEKPGETNNIPLRKNVYKNERLPEERNFSGEVNTLG
jgi:hypothetical protein